MRPIRLGVVLNLTMPQLWLLPIESSNDGAAFAGLPLCTIMGAPC
jgi:hypothetical protein